MAYRITDDNVQFDAEPIFNSSTLNGGVPTGASGVSVTEYGSGTVHKTEIAFADHAIAMATDDAGTDVYVAYGGSQVYDFPAGAIMILGATSDLDVTKSSAGIEDDWNGDFGIGTSTAVQEDLTGTEQNIVPKTATPQASAGATTANGQSTATENAVVDGTTTAVDVFVNFLVDAADHDVNDTACNLILNGTVTIHWINLGDY